MRVTGGGDFGASPGEVADAAEANAMIEISMPSSATTNSRTLPRIHM
ncbi:hypothetical protein [Nonomuraea typhae]|nr:hypothetical protein [Nonomuraea typhae]